VNAARLRSWAAWGARRGPDWFVRWAPVAIGIVAYCVAGPARRAVLSNLRRMHGKREPHEELLLSIHTFTAFARNLTEALCPERFAPGQRVVLRGKERVLSLLENTGVIMVTAHVGPWDNAAMTLSGDLNRPILMLLAEEADERAASIQDRVRASKNVQVLRLGSSPFSALGIAKHLSERGVVVAQMDRAVQGQKSVQGRLFGQPFSVTTGLIRLAAACGCPLVPVFSARMEGGARLVQVGDPITVQLHPQLPTLVSAAQAYLDQLEQHLRHFPTQWFHFVSEPALPSAIERDAGTS
jgi:lauroyl/myristoyl acyltransferase